MRTDTDLKGMIRVGSNNPGQNVKTLRDSLANYFIGEFVHVSWQYDVLL